MTRNEFLRLKMNEKRSEVVIALSEWRDAGADPMRIVTAIEDMFEEMLEQKESNNDN